MADTQQAHDGAGGPEQVRVDIDDDGDYAKDDQVYVERDKIDFDPDEGLYNGTAVDGTSSIPGPHEQQDDVEPEGESSEDAEPAEE